MNVVLVNEGRTLAFCDEFAPLTHGNVGCKINSGELVLLRGTVIPRDVSVPDSVASLCLDGMVMSSTSEELVGLRLEPLNLPFGDCVVGGGLTATLWSNPGASTGDVQSSMKILAARLCISRTPAGVVEMKLKQEGQWKVRLSFV
jgi:hypothetical protein